VTRFVRSVMAVFAGMFTNMMLTLGVTALVVFAFPPLVEGSVPNGSPPNVYIVFNLLYSALFAGAGGWVAARLAPTPKMRTAFLYAMVLLALGTVYFVEARGGVQPDWYLIGLMVLGVPAALMGGRLGTGAKSPETA
jgi:hypothetical protein